MSSPVPDHTIEDRLPRFSNGVMACLSFPSRLIQKAELSTFPDAFSVTAIFPPSGDQRGANSTLFFTLISSRGASPADPETQSAERFSYVRDAYWGYEQMKLPDPRGRTREMSSSLSVYGEVLSQDELLERELAIKREEVLAHLTELTPDRAHTIVFKGKKQ